MLFGGGFPPTAGDGPASARLSVDSKRSPHEFGTKKIPAHLRERLNPVNRLGAHSIRVPVTLTEFSGKSIGFGQRHHNS